MSDRLYLLDTNILSDLIRNPAGVAFQRLALVVPQTVCTSIIVASELRFGAEKAKSARFRMAIDGLLQRLSVLPFDGDADLFYGRLRATLEASGVPISPNDLFIAAHALSLGLTLVTHNIREFGRIPDLKVEDWLA